MPRDEGGGVQHESSHRRRGSGHERAHGSAREQGVDELGRHAGEQAGGGDEDQDEVLRHVRADQRALGEVVERPVQRGRERQQTAEKRGRPAAWQRQLRAPAAGQPGGAEAGDERKRLGMNHRPNTRNAPVSVASAMARRTAMINGPRNRSFSGRGS